MSDDSALQFLDTNVLIYAHDRSAGAKHDRARMLITDLWNSGKGCLSIQVLQEFYVNVTRNVPRPLDGPTAAQIISDLARWTVHVPNVADVLGAIEVQQRNQISFWDAMIVASAVQLGCEVIWSEDLKPGHIYEGVRVTNPFEAQSASP